MAPMAFDYPETTLSRKQEEGVKPVTRHHTQPRRKELVGLTRDGAAESVSHDQICGVETKTPQIILSPVQMAMEAIQGSIPIFCMTMTNCIIYYALLIRRTITRLVQSASLVNIRGYRDTI